MTLDTVDLDATAGERVTEGGISPWLVGAVVAIAALAAGALFGWLVARPDTPGDASVEVGFARDMASHHAQAVEMALIVRDTTENEEIRVLATDIILTQQAQIGMMRGWLDVWELSPNASGPPMAWADMSGHAMAGMDGGLMPGMATREQLAALRGMVGLDADREFLTLMIAHHQGGVMMAEAALAGGEHDAMRRLAESIVVAQQSEIDLMQSLLAASS